MYFDYEQAKNGIPIEMVLTELKLVSWQRLKVIYWVYIVKILL